MFVNFKFHLDPKDKKRVWYNRPMSPGIQKKNDWVDFPEEIEHIFEIDRFIFAVGKKEVYGIFCNDKGIDIIKQLVSYYSF